MSVDGVRTGNDDRTPGKPRVHVSSTMEDVAAAAGVSRTSVSRVMLGQKKVSEETRRRVFSAAERLGYVPNVLASELASRGTSTVGLLLRDASNPAYGLLFTRLQEAAHAAELTLVTMTINADDRGRHQVAGLHRLMGLRVAGLIVATGGVTSHQLEPFNSRIPIIRAGRPETTKFIHAVSYDEVHAGRSLANCVADAGHREVAVLATSEDVSYPEYVRSTTMVSTLVDRGVRAISVPLGANPLDGVEAAVALARERSVGAIMCPSDLRQLQVLRALAAVGLSAPADVSVSGCDGVLPGGDLLGLTTYRIPVEELAVRTVARMSDLLSNEPTPGVVAERLRGALVQGRTVGSPTPRKAP